MAKHKKVASDGERASFYLYLHGRPLLICGHLGQMKKLESVQTKVQRSMKTNPAQKILDSQLVNIMAPEAAKPKPRPRAVLKKSKPPMRLKSQGSKNQPPASELQSQSLSSPEEDMPRSQLRGPDSRFGFVPPDVIAEEDKNGPGDDEGDLDDGNNNVDDADTDNVHKAYNIHDDIDDNEVQSLTHSTSGLCTKDKQCARPLSPFWSEDDDTIPSPPRRTNNSPTKKKKHARPTSPSPSTDDGAMLSPPRVKKQTHAHPVSRSQPANDGALSHPQRADNLSRPQRANNSHAHSVSSMDSGIPSPPRRHEAANNQDRARSQDQLVDNSPNNAGSIRDVLEDYHAKNHRPRPPNPDRLKHLCQQAADELSANKADQVVDSSKKCLGGFEEEVMTRVGIEYLTETLDNFAADDISVEDGYWDRYKRDMAIILWDDRATMRSEMKKAARPLAATKFGILPSDIDNDNEFEGHVSRRVTELLDGGYFLQNGVDEQGRTNNLAHDALGELCTTVFYKGDNALVKVFPDVFAEAVPEGAVALAATALAAAIDEYKTGVYLPTKFAADLYHPIYDNVVELYKTIQVCVYGGWFTRDNLTQLLRRAEFSKIAGGEIESWPVNVATIETRDVKVMTELSCIDPTTSSNNAPAPSTCFAPPIDLPDDSKDLVTDVIGVHVSSFSDTVKWSSGFTTILTHHSYTSS
ncbi:hypothetical protein DEU56DRAFT_912051 [Suillus clintonianus]|uniref:uncharacterized protein n=1 Tax=Suillus clintonianus TaxID=1904413 RepID=UPI001B86BD70|nr:uncharacterized protein DEU56DRAFT_912051 [Suillus clintonianus]KAG2139785.1 hypothetical protein DEU56DRAFT_912051 [Suillus clintonianus]